MGRLEEKQRKRRKTKIWDFILVLKEKKVKDSSLVVVPFEESSSKST